MVLKANRVTHSLASQRLTAQQDSNLIDAMAGLSVKEERDDTSAVDKVADLITAMTLTDEGSDFTKQPSKLWSSRSEFQLIRERSNPVEMHSVSLIEVERSVDAVLHAQPLASAPVFQAGVPVDSTNSRPPLSPTVLPWHRASHSRTATFAPPQKPIGVWAKRALDILTQVEGQTRAIYTTLVLPEGFDAGHAPQVGQMRALLQAAAEHVDSAGHSLQLVRLEEQEVVNRKETVVALLKQTDVRISFLGAALPPLPPDTTPFLFDAAHIYEHRVEKLDTIAQIMILLGIVCNVIMGLSTNPCNFIISVVTLIVKMAMATRLSRGLDNKETYDGNQSHILDQLPTSLYTALNRFNIDGRTTMYAVCPTCNCCWKPSNNHISANADYPTECANRIAGPSQSRTCQTKLLVERNGHLRPIKPFLVASFADYLARSLSDAETERLCDKACDDAMGTLNDPANGDMSNIFHAQFMKSFEGPVHGQLFIDRGDKVRLAFAIQTDFFNPNGSRKRGNHDSIGIISLINLNLSEDIRIQPEHIFLAGIIPGPREPEKEEVSHFLRPVIDECVIGWERGIHISKTASCPNTGRDVEVAIVVSINDLPAARKVSGTAGHRSDFYCTVCSCYGRETMYNSDFNKWKPRNVTEMRQQAEAWQNAQTVKERDNIFAEYGVRWSEFWRLPYWDPSRMLVIDSMHCILEGLVHYHCRYVLELDAKQAKASPTMVAAFDHPWSQYGSDVPLEYRVKHDRETKQIPELHDILVLPIGSCPGSFTEDELRTKLMRKNLSPLKFVCYSLGLQMEVLCEQNRLVPAKSKKQFTDLLINWRRTKPLTSGSPQPKTTTASTIKHIQRIIKETVTPSWVGSVPACYGENSAGTIKADEWRVLSTVYLPIALITLWGEENGAPPEEGSHFLNILDHTMALFQAVTIVCRYTMNVRRATEYRNLIKRWVDGLHEYHPHTKKHSHRPNVHASFHLYDFLLLFGPVMSWWCFPFERLIGTLQKINTNDQIGGELEVTITKSFMRGANLRRWLKRPECPEVIRQFKRLFDVAFSPKDERRDNDKDVMARSKLPEHAYHMHNGFVFSRSSTHLGNSLILYYPTPSSLRPVAGSIQKIDTSGDQVYFVVKRQATLPPMKFDPFRRYSFFPASLYSSEMDNGPNDRIRPPLVVSHVARFNISAECAVVVNLSRA